MNPEHKCLFCNYFSKEDLSIKDNYGFCEIDEEIVDENEICKSFSNYLDSDACECPCEDNENYKKIVTFRVCTVCSEFQECWRYDG